MQGNVSRRAARAAAANHSGPRIKNQCIETCSFSSVKSKEDRQSVEKDLKFGQFLGRGAILRNEALNTPPGS